MYGWGLYEKEEWPVIHLVWYVNTDAPSHWPAGAWQREREGGDAGSRGATRSGAMEKYGCRAVTMRRRLWSKPRRTYCRLRP